jgi:hypothetical protein
MMIRETLEVMPIKKDECQRRENEENIENEIAKVKFAM